MRKLKKVEVLCVIQIIVIDIVVQQEARTLLTLQRVTLVSGVQEIFKKMQFFYIDRINFLNIRILI